MNKSVVKGAAAPVGSHTPDDEEQQAPDRDTSPRKPLQAARQGVQAAAKQGGAQ